MRMTTRLKELFYRKEIFVLAGGGCAFHAKMAEAVGFESFYMSGAHSASAILGIPDAGLITMTEMVENAKRIADVVNIPVFSDSDSGFGNAINVRRTVQSFVRAGVGGCHIEDQVTPKRCGFIAGKEVISIEEAAGKYRAAVDAKNELDPDFVICARCDARTAVGGGLEDVIARAKAYREAGVDVFYFERPMEFEEVRIVKKAFGGGPIMASMMSTGRPLSLQEQEELGLSAAWYARLMCQAGWVADWDYAMDFKKRGVAAEIEFMERNNKHPLFGYGEFNLVGFPKVKELEEKYLPADSLKKYAPGDELYAKSWYTPSEAAKASQDSKQTAKKA